jgi:DNA-binding transcriptional ArsR family regulator
MGRDDRDRTLVLTHQAAGLAALGNRTRLEILERLADRPQAVVELARHFRISRPAISKHLRVLKKAGLVTDRRAGYWRIYRVDPEEVDALRAYLNEVRDRTLTAFKAAVDDDSSRRESSDYELLLRQHRSQARAGS